MDPGLGYSSCVMSGQENLPYRCASSPDCWTYGQPESFYDNGGMPVLQAMQSFPYQPNIASQPWFCKRGEQTYSFEKFLPHASHPNSIARRNERERNRVKTINSTFAKLRNHLPSGTKNKKLSKVQILRNAIQYINQLQHILDTQDQEQRDSIVTRIKEEKPDSENEHCGDIQSGEVSSYLSSQSPVTSPATAEFQRSPPSSVTDGADTRDTDDQELADLDWI